MSLLWALTGAPAASLAEGPKAAGERLLLRTVGGDIVLGLIPDAAPEYVSRLLKLARMGVLDSTHFFRVVPNGYAQLSAVTDRSLPLSPEQEAAISPVSDEYTALLPLRGDLFFARDLSKPDDTKTSFSILLADGPRRLGRYTVFGRVESGMDVLESFQDVPRDRRGRPAARLEILAAEIVPAAELKKRRLAPARPVTRVATAVLRAASAGLAVLTALSAIGWFLRKRFPRTAASLCLLNVFIGVFLIVALSMPAAPHDPLLGSALFIALLGVLKLMSRFESPA